MPAAGVIVGITFGASLKVKVKVATSPARKALSLLVITTVGAVVSTPIDNGETIEPLELPAGSLHSPILKVTVPASILAGGVKVAVKTNGSLVAINELNVPALAVILGNCVGTSLNLKVNVADSPILKTFSSAEIKSVGLTVSTATTNGVLLKTPTLPAASVQAPTEKVIVPAAVLAGGVNVAW